MDGQTGLDRRTFFKGAGLVGASLAVPSLLSACGGEGAGATGGAQKLEFWWNPSVESADQMTAWMNGVIKEFTAANKGTSIESTTQPSEQLASNFRTACQAKSGSDLQHEYSGPYTMQFVWEKCIAPLDGTLDAETMGHVLPPQALDIYKFQSASISHANYSRYEDKTLDDLYVKQARAVDAEERKKALRAFEKRLLDEEVHYIYTLQWHRIIPHSAKMKGWTITPSHYLNQQLDAVWLTD